MNKPGSFTKELVVEFGGVSANKETVAIGLKIDRKRAGVDTMEEFFCGRRLQAEIRLEDGESRLPGMVEDEPPLSASWDALSYHGKLSDFGTRLRTTKDLDMGVLCGYSGKAGRLLIHSVETIEDHEADGAAADDEPEAKTRPAGEGDDDPITALGLPAGLTKSITSHRADALGQITTVGKLVRLIESNEWWHRDVKGVGPTKIDRITDALLDWREKQPD